jgi:very-short-patch-repair endonuclease
MASSTHGGQRDDHPFRRRDTSGATIARTRRAALLIDRLAEIVCAAPRGALASGATAAALHGFDGFELTEPFHIAVPRQAFTHRLGVVIHSFRSFERIDGSTVDGIPTLSATRTLIDIAPTVDRQRLDIALSSALRDGLTSERFLSERIAAISRKGFVGPRVMLDVLNDPSPSRGGHSALERMFLDECALRRLDRPLTQQVLTRAAGRLVRVDCRFPNSSVVVELLGHRYHRTSMQLQRDSERINALLLAGLHPLQFTWLDLTQRCEAMFESITTALSRFPAAA